MKLWKFILCLLVIAVGCSSRDPRLVRVQEIVSDSPQKALSMLDSIDRGSLNEADRYFYDLMKIKGTDKSYIKHKTDSVILKVKEYYSRDKESDEYLEAVYYCGRVLTDLGDHPSAIKYFQNVIDLTEDDTSRNRLIIRGNALAFVEHRLSYLELYDEVFPYLKEMIRVDGLLRDTTNLLTDYKSLAHTYIVKSEYSEAEKTLRKARELANVYDVKRLSEINSFLGGVKYNRGEYIEALEYIWQALSEPDPASESVALTYAAYVHYDLANYDSAAYYAYKLIESKDSINKKNGYDILLRNELKDVIGIDSANKYVFRYRDLLNREFKGNRSKMSLIQNAQYNYESHKKERDKIKKVNLQLTYLLYAASCVIVFFAIIYLFQLLRKKNKMLRFYDALALVLYLQRREGVLKLIGNCVPDPTETVDPSHTRLLLEYKISEKREDEEFERSNQTDISCLRDKLTQELMLLQEAASDKYILPDYISQSEIYNELRKAIVEKQSKVNDADFWRRMEIMFEEENPTFIKNLTILMGGKLKEEEKYMAMLIKCGVAPSEMMIILSKEKGTISSRRIRLGMKAFDIKMSTKMVDRLIRLL